MRLTDEQRMLRDVARDFARTWLAPFAAERDREEKFPAGAVTELGKLGFMGLLVPEEFAGQAPTMSAMPWSWRRSPPARAGCDDPQRAELGRLHAGLAIRVGGAETAVPPADEG
jgi:alkylation response protein AidB-like acyl-CoA dehydrogenase